MDFFNFKIDQVMIVGKLLLRWILDSLQLNIYKPKNNIFLHHRCVAQN